MIKILLLLLITFSLWASPPIERVVLTSKNFVTITGEITRGSLNPAIKKLLKLNKLRKGLPSRTLYIIINSGGGDIDEAIKFISYIKKIPNIKTIIITAASAAHLIVQHLPGERLIIDYGYMMDHAFMIGDSFTYPEGSLVSNCYSIERQGKYLKSITAARVGSTYKDYMNKVRIEYEVFGTQAIDEKWADKLVDVKCDPTAKKYVYCTL